MNETRRVFDEETQAEILELLGGERYCSSLKEMIAEIDTLREQFENLSEKEQIAEVHKSSGVAAMLGVIGVHSLLLEVEIAGKSGDDATLQKSWNEFISAWSDMREAVMNFAAASSQ